MLCRFRLSRSLLIHAWVLLPAGILFAPADHAAPGQGEGAAGAGLRVVEGRFALLSPEAPAVLRVAEVGASDVTEISISERARFVRGERGGVKHASSLDELEMGDHLSVTLNAEGAAEKVRAAYVDWRNAAPPGETVSDPQYLGIHRTTTGGGTVGAYWSQIEPDSINQKGIDELLGMLGTRGDADRQLAFSYSISYMNTPLDDSVRTLQNLLDLADRNNLAVIVHLDGVNFWGYRSDLWNWWDPERPGYDPDNVNNVEWYDWGSEHAVRIGWRNWGRQIRVVPQVNLASPAILAAHREKLGSLIPLIRDWYEGLEEDRKYLLAGVVLGWEVSPYVQSFYYAGGNEYLSHDPASDPTGGSGKSVPLGYAALTAMNRAHGGAITGEDIDAVVRYYLDEMVNEARRLGLPREKIIAHSIIHPGTPTGGAHSGVGAIVDGAMPGWSFYGVGLDEVDPLLDQIDGAPWAAIEMKFWGLSAELLESFFDHRNCRIVNIFNWESIRFDSNTVDVLQKVLGAVDDTGRTQENRARPD